MKITVVAHTSLLYTNVREASGNRWEPQPMDDDASALAEFAGRACYQSWGRPNPATADNEGYLRNILHQQHFSVIEHGTVSFYIEEVSRSLTHELVRHRHFSFSQLSQRYVNMADAQPVMPPLYADDDHTCAVIRDFWNNAVVLYEGLVARYEAQLIAAGTDNHTARKRAREAARCVLPNAAPTAILVTGNHRTWREFLVKRGSMAADAEMRVLALLIFDKLLELEPSLYQDFAVSDGQVVQK